MSGQKLLTFGQLVIYCGLYAAMVTGCVAPEGDNATTSDRPSVTPKVVEQPASVSVTPSQPRQPTSPPPSEQTTTTATGTAEPGLPTNEQWAKLRNCESSGRYDISSTNGKYHGAYQFTQETWNTTATGVGRADLFGVKPSAAKKVDQDSLAVALYRKDGSKPWGRKCGAFLNN